MFLELENLQKSFGNRAVVRDLSLQMKEGELLCLLGPSGCGKSTTLGMIGGFLAPDGGRIRVDGQDITAMKPEYRPVSTVFQSYALFPHMTVLQNVVYGLRVRGYSRRDAAARGMEFLALSGLQGEGDVPVTSLSGGQQQRVALCRALAVEPKVLLLDEPLSNLDAQLRLRLREELKTIQKELRTTMIFVTHDREEAMMLADRVAIMDGGVLLQVGDPETLYRHPNCGAVMEFLGPVCALTAADGTVRLLRPEQLRLDPSGDLAGTVLERTFLGFYSQYRVAVGADVLLLRTEPGRCLAPGEAVRLTVEEG